MLGRSCFPFLFILAMEILHVAIYDVVVTCLFKVAKVSKDSDYIPSFLSWWCFIDGEWMIDNILNIMNFLNCFYLIYGMRLNLQKSSLLEVEVVFEEVKQFSKITCFSPDKFSFIYLDIPIGSNMDRVQGSQVIFERFGKKNSKCKANMLSIGGRSYSCRLSLVCSRFIIFFVVLWCGAS